MTNELQKIMFVIVSSCHFKFTCFLTSDADCSFKYNKTIKGLVIMTPKFEFGVDYPNDKTCGWIIESPEEEADITIKFDTFVIESTIRCSKYDYVMFYKQSKGQDEWQTVRFF